MLADLVEFSNMRDWHVPFAKSHPPAHQRRDKFLRGTQDADNEITYFGEMPPREIVRAGHEVLREGTTRTDLPRVCLGGTARSQTIPTPSYVWHTC